MPHRLNWDDEAFRAKVRQTMVRRVTASAIIVEDHAKRLISKAGTASAITTGWHKVGKMRTRQFAKRKGRLYNVLPSEPGEPPHKQYGHLRRSVTHERVGDRLAARTGTNLKYGRWLELGTAYMAARPWLRRALLDQSRRIRRILIAKID